jgi:hypothetical protein
MAIRNSKRRINRSAAQAVPKGNYNPEKVNDEKGTRRVPSYNDLINSKAVEADVYELTKKEIQTVRSRIYALNKDNQFGWRWRTLVEPTKGLRNQLLIWRIH